jgi:ribonuclease BN (tRNA processing enzyme)
MSMELVALGSSASFPAAGGACSGYLVRHGATELLLDCGTGVLSRLQLETSVHSLTAIVITHFHPDHYLDLVPMRYGLHYGIEAPFRPLLYLPPGGIALLERVGIGLRNSSTYFSKAFDMHEYDPESELTLGSLTLTFQLTTHDEPTWAVAVSDSESRLVYSADTRESDEVERFAMGADLFLCESTYPADLADIPSHNHLTSRQAGELAQRAGVHRLVLTHFWPGIDLSRYAAEAETAFSGPVKLAEPGFRIRIAKATELMAAST